MSIYAMEIRSQAEVAPHAALPEIARALWAAFGEERVTEAEAEALSALIEARTALPLDHRTTGQAAHAPPDRLGSPRAAAAHLGHLRSIFPARRLQRAPDRSVAIERRRRLAASGPMPPALAARFTTGQLSVLRIVADEVAKTGACGLCLDAIAARAGVSRRLAQTAIRLAENDGLILVQERRRKGNRNLTNVITVLSREWTAWIARAARGGGCRNLRPSDSQVLNSPEPGSEREGRGRIAALIAPRRAALRAASA